VNNSPNLTHRLNINIENFLRILKNNMIKKWCSKIRQTKIIANMKIKNWVPTDFIRFSLLRIYQDMYLHQIYLRKARYLTRSFKIQKILIDWKIQIQWFSNLMESIMKTMEAKNLFMNKILRKWLTNLLKAKMDVYFYLVHHLVAKHTHWKAVRELKKVSYQELSNIF
jgi:hypothetical protein